LHSSLAAAAALTLLSGLPVRAAAQRPVTALDSMRVRVDSLMRQLDSLRALLARSAIAPPVAADTSDPLARIRAAAAAAAGADTVAPIAAGAPQFVSRQRNLSALNPEISVTGDVFAFARSRQTDSNNFVPREFEFSFISNLDPFSRAKIFVAHHVHGGEIPPFGEEESTEEAHGSEVEIEEGYVEWVNLPAGIGLTLGKFRQRFGRLNRWHAHALPAQQLPLPYVAYLGEEGLAQTGVSLHWLAPVHGFGTWEAWGEVTRSSSETVFGESNGISALAHINAFFELSPATYFELGISGLTGGREETVGPTDPPGATGTRLVAADFTFDWRPPERATYRQFTLHGAAMLNRRTFEQADGVDAFGAFAIAEFKFARQWILGARYEYAENPALPDENAWLFAPALTWWQSEFVRLRAEYDVYRGPLERFGQFVLQATFAMGPHKHENY
jgi:hypothetical protein